MESPQTPHNTPSPPPERTGILLVDDTPANLVALRAILDAPDYDLVDARSGEEALKRLKAQEFAAVLLDVRMPGLSGFDTAKLVRADERSRHTPIIFLTADDIDRAQIEAGYALGAVDFFVKPLSPVVVQAKVRGFVTLFQQKERAKQEAEQLRLIVQGTTDYAIFMLDPQGRVATWNAGAERLKGYRPNEIIGQHFSTFYPQDVIDRGWPEHELKVATAEGRFEDEGWRLRKDGSRFWANVVITALRDEKGRLRGFSKVTRDLTERKRAEEALRRSEERFRHMVEGVQDYAIFMLDQHGNVATWNAGAERIKGYKADEIIGKHFSTFYPRDVADSGFPAHELKVAAAEGRFEDEGWRVRKDGSQFWANVVITAVKDDQGGLLGFTKVTRDLTARKQAEEALRRSEERFRLIVESAKDYAIFLLDPQGHVASWNPGAERIKGYTAADIIGKHFSTFYPQEALDRGWPAHELKVAAAEGRFEDEGWRVRKDGSQFWANVVITALKDERGNLLGFSKITRDLTERKRAEEGERRLAAEQAARQVAHEERERLHVTLASIGDAVISTDAQGRVEFLNPVAEQLVGWRSGEAAGKRLEDVFRIVNENTRQPVENPALRALREGKIVGLANHTVLISKDGTERPIDDSAAPIKDATGNRIGSVLVFRDISERRRAEQGLRASEARKSAVLETSPDAIITMDHEGKVVEFNPAAERMFGHRREAVVGEELAGFVIPPSLRERHRHGMAHYLATGEGPVLGHRLELPALRADGSEFPVEVSITRISADGLPLFTAYLRDITEAKRAEQHRNTRLAVTQVLSQAADVREGVGGVLRAVCETIGWDVGSVWMPNGDRAALSCLQSWHTPDLPVAEFEQASRSRTFASGEGLPGRVWATARPAWILDVTSDPAFPRAAAAAKYGLHSAVASPLVVGERALGVIEFFTRRIRELDPDLMELLGTVAGNVGQFVQRRRAEDELRASAERLNLALTAADLGDWSWDAASDVVTFSDRAADVFGIPPGPHMTWTEMQGLLHPDDRDRARHEVERVIAERVQYDIEYRVNRRDGSQVWVGVLGRAIYDAADQVVGMYGVVQDITDRKGMEESLRSSEERLRLALDAGRMGVWDWNVRTGDLKWSDSLEPLHGLAPGTFGGTFDHFQQLVHPDDRAAVQSAIRQALETGGEFSVEFRNLRQSGGVHWIAGSGKVFPGDDGQPLRMIGVGLDVTRRKRSEQTARFLADASAALAVLVDFDSTLQKVASLAVPAFADWASVDVLEADGTLRRVAVAHVDPAKVQLAHDLHRRFPPDPSAPNGVWNILRTGQAELVPEITDAMLVASVKDGELLRIMRELGLKSYIGVPLTVRGKPLGVLTFIAAESGHAYDETDLAVAKDLGSRAAIAVENTQLYRELRDADRRKDEFLAVLAHELRNPLAPIRNGLQVLRLAGGGGEMVAEARSMMERQLAHMVRLVDDLLDVSRITRNKLELRRERVALATVIHAAVETSRPLIEQSGHTFSVTLAPAPVYLDADPVRLAQVFSNLLTNAAKYTEPGGRITLTAEQQGAEAVVRVRDNGLGIPVEAQPGIFEMFSQVDRNMERAQGGLGIGLTLVRRLTEMHGGTVGVTSEGPGRGSEFTVRIPVLTEVQPGSGSRTSGPGAVAGARRRILVVDDNRDAAESLGMMLTLMGNEVRTAHDGLAAVEAAEAYRPEMILLDIGLPKMNGYDACRHIRGQAWANGTVIVALTGWGQEEDRRRSQEAGFDHHLVKPVDVDDLTKLLSQGKR